MAKAQLSTEGREFWIGFMEIIPNNPPVQKLYITSKVNTTVTVTMGSPSAPTMVANNQPITANQITTISLPSNAQTTGSETKQSIAVRVTSPDFVSVFASNESNARSEASVVIPVNSLGGNTEYIVAAYQGSTSTTSGGTPRSQFIIVALEDNTIVNITPTTTTRGGRAAGVTFATPVLNKGDVFQVQALNVTGDLTGTRLTASGSCKPFVVFAGANATLTAANCNAWEHLVEQLTPIQTWGTQYLVTPFRFSVQGYSYRIFAKDNNTVVSINGVPTYTMSSGQFQEVQVTNETAFCVTADKPICVAQYKKGQDCNGFPPAGNVRLGDPALLILNPLNQTIKDIAFFTFPLNGGSLARYFVNIVTRTASTGRINLNGLLVPSSSFINSPCGQYAYASVEIPLGNHRISSDSSFIAYAYGFGQAEGFAYSVGGAFENQQFNFNLPTTACVGQNIPLQGTGNVLGFSWNFGNGQTATGQNTSVTYNTPGFYEVTMTVTISGGCGTDFVRKTIEILPFPTANLGSNRSICPNTTTTLSAGVQPTGTTYLWSNGATTPSITVGAGTYSVTVTNRAGCATTSNSVTISFHPVTNVTTNILPEYCINAPAFTMVGTPSGGVFRINGNVATQFNPATLGAGTHSVTYIAQDVNNCTVETAQNVVVKPVATLSFNVEGGYCVNSNTINLVGTPAGGSFTINGNTATQFNPNALGVGTHSVVYSYTNPNGCVNTLQKSIQVWAKPNPTITGATAVCVETIQTYSVNASAGTTYTWSVTDAVGTILSGQGTNQITVRWNSALTNAGLQIVETNANNCTETATLNLVVNPKPTLQITHLNPSYCIDAPAFNLTATPVGGAFTINGNSATQFNPATLGAGTHTIVYNFTDSNGCQNSATQSVQVFALPVLTIQNLANRYCIDASPTPLTATPAGGIFRINNNIATQFNPTALGVGTHIVTYTFTDANNCTNIRTQNVEVVPLPTLAFVGLQNQYCIDAPAFALSATPAGGTFRINNNASTQFNPNTLGVGTHMVEYSFTDANNCQNILQQSVAVHPLPTPSIIGLAPVYCLNSGIIPLQGNPAGGIFRINGNVTTQVNPTALGIGSYNVTYTYTDANNCTQTVSQALTIEAPRADINITGLNFKYCINANPFDLTATPTGGVFTINNVVVTQVNPAQLGAGIKTVFYTYTDPRTNCSVTVSKDFEISNLSAVSIVNLGTLNNTYCLNAPPFTLQATPAGGVFTINGEVKTQFNPAELGAGKHTIIYNYQDINGCTNTDFKTITIPELPIVAFANLKDNYCSQNEAVILAVTPPTAGSFLVNGVPNSTFNPQTLGEGTHIVRFIEPTGCVDLSKQVLIKRPPEPTKYENLRICSNSEDTIFVTATKGKKYLWNTGDTTQTIALRRSGLYTIKVTDELGCFTESSFSVIDECFPAIYVPNAFSPNNDGLNDKLEIFGRHFDKFETWIFNKWGEIVFRSNDRYVNWDGTYLGKEVPSDTYVCKIRFRYLPNSPMLERVFSVTLIR